MAIKSLRQRLSLLVLAPVGLLLFLTGVFGFVYVRGALIEEWRDASIVKLQRAAHQIDMKLAQVINWVQMFHKTSGSRGGPLIQQWILEQIRDVKGVTRAELIWKDPGAQEMPMSMSRMGGGRGGRGGMDGLRMMRFHRAKELEVGSPRYDARVGQQTVDVISQLKDESDEDVGTLTVTIRFDDLLAGIKAFGWWQTDQACLIEDNGTYLSHTEAFMKGRRQLGKTGDPLEMALLKAMKEKPYGTVLGPGRPSDDVGGFYRLKYAPWTILLFAPGKKVLAPIIRFRTYFFAGGAMTILLILFLIRTVVGKMVRSFIQISQAATRVAKGDYTGPIPEKGRDELGDLTRSFNAMMEGLKERDFIANTFGRYMDQEIARELLEHPEAVRLGGQRRDVAIMMSDIRGFTSLSETLSPEQIIGFLNRYFAHIIEIIQRHRGIIVDFFGDSVLVFFDPLKDPVGPVVQRAVVCALELQKSMKEFNREMLSGNLPSLEMGIGINAGEVVVGNIGSETRAKYGIVGSPVNLTQRIQSTAEAGEVVISDSVYTHVRKTIRIKRQFTIRLKGVQEAMTLHVVEDPQSEMATFGH